ncbi:hypothetical protein [Streptomyces rochei]
METGWCTGRLWAGGGWVVHGPGRAEQPPAGETVDLKELAGGQQT